MNKDHNIIPEIKLYVSREDHKSIVDAYSSNSLMDLKYLNMITHTNVRELTEYTFGLVNNHVEFLKLRDNYEIFDDIYEFTHHMRICLVRLDNQRLITTKERIEIIHNIKNYMINNAKYDIYEVSYHSR